jgi:hypothetical protein
MTGFWRSVYYYLNWSYDERRSNRQRHLKYICNKELLLTDKDKLLGKINYDPKINESNDIRISKRIKYSKKRKKN